MLAVMIIVFREVFEMAIVICVIMAATKGLAHRSYWIFMGAIIGAIGAAVLGILLAGLSHQIIGDGKLIFNAIILFFASLLIAWMVIWMKYHGRELTRHLKSIGQNAMTGELPMRTLAVVAGLAVLREGSEVIIFLTGMQATGDINLLQMLGGSIIGILLGIITGVLMYFGLLRIPVNYLFKVTSTLLALIAAGMVANGVGKLIKAHLLPALISPTWDTSSVLPQHSMLGRLLSVLIGYQQRPEAIQLIFYLGFLLLMFLIIKWIVSLKKSV